LGQNELRRGDDSRISFFAGSDGGGESAAAIYGLLGTAKLNGIDPESYLRNVLSRIADHPIKRIEELLPWNVAASLQLPIHEAP
jgi:transposase